MKRRWLALVRLLDERERATSLACVRILVGACVVVDGLNILFRGLAPVLWGAPADGGLSPSMAADPPWLAGLVGPEGILALYLLGGASLLVGLLPRAGALVLLLASADISRLLAHGDRGIDVMIRLVALVLVFSRAGATLSLDTRLRTGRFTSATRIPAWPRYLILLQLLWCYFSAGHNKSGQAWYPWGGLEAVWNVLHDPHFSAVDVGQSTLVYHLSQVLTLGTLVFEWTAPLMLLALYDARHPEDAGRLRRLLRRTRFRWVWMATGVTFHLGLAATLWIGIFPYAMLALYPSLVPPERVEASFPWLRPPPASAPPEPSFGPAADVG